MTTKLDKDRTVGALLEELAAVEALAAELDDGDWHRPTALPGWDVQANIAHIIGTEEMLAGRTAPARDTDLGALAHVRNDIGRANEAWVLALAGATPAEVRAQLRTTIEDRTATLGALSQDEWDAEGFTPAGTDTFGRFVRIRVFDCWMHEQDVRDAVEQPGHLDGPAVELALDELVTAMGYVVGKRAGAPDGARVTLALTGDAARDIHVAVDGRAAVVPELDRDPAVVVTTDVHTFSRLAGGRVRWEAIDQSLVDIDGDVVLGNHILAHLGYTI